MTKQRRVDSKTAIAVLSLTLFVLLLKCLHSLHWSARGPVHPFWHSMLQAGTASLFESLDTGGSAVPYIFKYQVLRVPLFPEEPGMINGKSLETLFLTH